MTIDVEQLEIVLYPHPTLREVAAPVDDINDEIRAIAKRMLKLMRQANGIGLAAPQVGLGIRMFVANWTGDENDDKVYINPVLRSPGRQMEEMKEGCLSLPGIEGSVRRPNSITIEAKDLNGNRFTETDRELGARVWQHEFDHLDGVLIIDKMPHLERLGSRAAIKDLERKFEEQA